MRHRRQDEGERHIRSHGGFRRKGEPSRKTRNNRMIEQSDLESSKSVIQKEKKKKKRERERERERDRERETDRQTDGEKEKEIQHKKKRRRN